IACRSRAGGNPCSLFLETTHIVVPAQAGTHVCCSREQRTSSFPRRREGGFTFEVQQFGKDLGRGLPAEALPGRVIVESGELLQLPRRDGAQVGLARQQPP